MRTMKFIKAIQLINLNIKQNKIKTIKLLFYKSIKPCIFELNTGFTIYTQFFVFYITLTL